MESGHIPLTVAMKIATADEAGVQQILCEGYEDKSLRGRKLLAVRRIIELRKTMGKRFTQVFIGRRSSCPRQKRSSVPTARKQTGKSS